MKESNFHQERLGELLLRTTENAALAGKLAMDMILSIDPEISWYTNKATIDFKGKRHFCSLWPVKNHITFWITNNGSVKDPESRLAGKGKASFVKLSNRSDVDDYLKSLVIQSYQSEGSRPLKAQKKKTK